MAMGPWFMFDASMMSSMRRNSMSQLLRMMRMNSRRSSGASMICSRSLKPTMAFSGVRISWVMLARKTLFSLPDSSARRLSSFSRS